MHFDVLKSSKKTKVIWKIKKLDLKRISKFKFRWVFLLSYLVINLINMYKTNFTRNDMLKNTWFRKKKYKSIRKLAHLNCYWHDSVGAWNENYHKCWLMVTTRRKLCIINIEYCSTSMKILLACSFCLANKYFYAFFRRRFFKYNLKVRFTLCNLLFPSYKLSK